MELAGPSPRFLMLTFDKRADTLRLVEGRGNNLKGQKHPE